MRNNRNAQYIVALYLSPGLGNESVGELSTRLSEGHVQRYLPPADGGIQIVSQSVN